MARPRTFDIGTVVRLAPDGTSKLQTKSDRRAIVNFILDNGGKAAIHEIDAKLGFDTRDIVRALVACNWLIVEE